MVSSTPYAAKQRGRFLLFLLIILATVLLLQTYLPTLLWQRTQTFVTIFLGIFIEAAPFLVAGALVSGLIAEFVSPDLLQRFSPRHPVGAAVTGGLLGLAFPVCECGVVPVTRRLYRKGLPLSTGIAFLLAAAMQVLVPQSLLLAWGKGPVLSVLALMALAFVLSVCSTVDAFIALAFVNTFSPGAVLAFLVFGPMVDIKSLLLFRQVFNRRAIVYLVALPLLLTGIFGVIFNMAGG